MKAEKAIEELKRRIALIDKDYREEAAEYGEVLQTAIEALEKQIPKKPFIKPDKYTDVVQQYYCPNCGRYFGQAGIHNVILFNKERFCQGEGCGQAIDWDMKPTE